jgi:hypothetical protein
MFPRALSTTIHSSIFTTVAGDYHAFSHTVQIQGSLDISDNALSNVQGSLHHNDHSSHENHRVTTTTTTASNNDSSVSHSHQISIQQLVAHYGSIVRFEGHQGGPSSIPVIEQPPSGLLFTTSFDR